MDITISHLRNSNEKIFEGIVTSYWGRLYKFSLLYVLNREAAKEIVQDTFLSLWNKRKELKDDTDILTYLLVVNRNRCYNYLRAQKLETIDIHELSESQLYQRSNTYVLEGDSPSILIAKDLKQTIETSLNKLPPKTKEIFLMSRIQGLQNKEIAEQKNITIKTVEFHINKTLKQLRSDLSNEYFIWLLLIYVLMNRH